MQGYRSNNRDVRIMGSRIIESLLYFFLLRSSQRFTLKQWRDCGKGQTTSQLTTSIKLD